ncbi:hypothetical protein HZA97_04180 [Candidatus Woesearchaeota archaeon]|nr:hypothetical protein [Candidatus Woesearchaeota archaeon]
MEYEQLDELFIRDVVMVASAQSLTKKSDLSVLKPGLSKVVEALHQAYGEGLVESVKGLPLPEQVSELDDFAVSRLYLDLVERYFPHDVGHSDGLAIKMKD